MTDIEPLDVAARAAALEAEIRDAERQTAAVRLSNAGVSLAKITQQLGYADPAEASRDIAAALREIRTASVADMRARQVHLTKDLLRAIMTTALSGDVDAINATRGVMDHQAKLLGLYAPTRHRVAADDSDFAENAATLISEMGVTIEVPVPPTPDSGEPWAS